MAEVFSHNPDAVGMSFDGLGAKRMWFRTLLLACLPRAADRHGTETMAGIARATVASQCNGV